MHWFAPGNKTAQDGRKRSRFAAPLFAAAVLVVLVGCRMSTAPPVTHSADADGQMTFEVWVVPTREGIPGVEVFAVGSEGFVPIGKTDSGGRLVLDPQVLADIGPHVVVFCHDLFFCGALRVDESFYDYRVHNIGLSLFSID